MKSIILLLLSLIVIVNGYDLYGYIAGANREVGLNYTTVWGSETSCENYVGCAFTLVDINNLYHPPMIYIFIGGINDTDAICNNPPQISEPALNSFNAYVTYALYQFDHYTLLPEINAVLCYSSVQCLWEMICYQNKINYTNQYLTPILFPII